MSKSIWRIVFICAAALCLWRIGLAVNAAWHYWRLNTPISVTVNSWDIAQVGSSEYALIASFSYEFEGQRYENKIMFDKPYHLNRYAAQAEIKKWSQKSWTGWLDAKNPQFSSLEKQFPYLTIFYAFISLGVLLYFFYLYSLKEGPETLLSNK
ncbi:MAG TPA: hypothetical protein VLF61_02245 [Rhabdochlamydiaceae bacterium]|nr:hypothetical protein [Rhabdochlamydiaceae bacterium]